MNPLDKPIEPVTSWPNQLSETEFKAWRARRLFEIGSTIEELGDFLLEGVEVEWL